MHQSLRWAHLCKTDKFLWPKTDLYISQQVTKLKIMYHKRNWLRSLVKIHVYRTCEIVWVLFLPIAVYFYCYRFITKD